MDSTMLSVSDGTSILFETISLDIEGSEIDLQEIDDAYEEGLDQSELMGIKTDEEQQDGA